MAPPLARNQPRRPLTGIIALSVILLPLAQAGLGALSAHALSPWYWLIGTPSSYLLIAGLGAFSATRGLTPAQARARGSLVGVLAGSGGAVVATVVLAVAIAVNLHSPPAPSAGLHTIPLGLVAVFFAPFFLAVNLLGIGLATLGGLLGGLLRASVTRQESPADERPGGVNGAVIIGIAALLAVLVGAAGFVFLTGAFSGIGVTTPPAP